MTPQENQLLQDFLDQLDQAQPGPRDREAQALIAQAFARRPDAAYLVVQRALMVEQALRQSQAQLARYQEQGSTFLGGARGLGPPATAASPAAPPGAVAPPADSGARAGATGGAMGSFLANAGATAAGVAGGAFLFQGLSSLFGHPGGGIAGAPPPNETVENVTVNNYGKDGDESPAEDDLADSADDSFFT